MERMIFPSDAADLPVEVEAGEALRNTEEPFASLEMNLRLAMGYLRRGQVDRVPVCLTMAIVIVSGIADREEGASGD